MSERLTRQGVRNLNPPGFNGRRLLRCAHFWGPLEVVGCRCLDEMSGTCRNVYGRRCVHCGESDR